MNPKNKITRKFNKSDYKLHGEIDPYIKGFLTTLNKSNNIMTLFSCEGHKPGDYPYLYFNVNEIGWDIFWQKVLPELSYKFGQPMQTWSMGVFDSEYSTGISIYGNLSISENVKLKKQEKILETKKQQFWNIMKEVFLKYYSSSIITKL